MWIWGLRLMLRKILLMAGRESCLEQFDACGRTVKKLEEDQVRASEDFQ